MFVPFHAFEASAGSGKTFSLVVRYLSLLFMGEAAEKILALTFTNKAANEMQERIVETLKGLEGRGELKEIVKMTGMSDGEILAQRDAVLGRFLESDAKVMTIDRFFAKILRKFSLYEGLMPTFSTFESQHELKVMARFLTLVDVHGKEELLIDLSLMMSKRLADIFTLLDELYAKRSELAGIAFQPEPFHPYEQQVMEAMERLRTLVQDNPGASATARSGVDAASIEEVMQKSWLERDSFDYRTFAKVYVPEMDGCLQQIQENLAHYMRAKEHHFMQGLLELLEIYTEAKRMVAKEDGELSFDDITSLVYHLLTGRIDSEFLYFRLDSRIDHLLLDEFQDTSVVQFEILRPIIEEMVAGQGSGVNRSLFMVGDVKQSIYRFRGGTKELFYAAADAYGVEVDRLTTNYRSHRNVVEFVNDVFLNKIDRYEPQMVRKDAGEGYVEVIEDEAVLECLVDQIRGLIDQGAAPNDIAVLTATNADGAEVEACLKDAGIDVVTETTSKLINQKPVRALIEYFKYAYFGETIYARNFFALIGREYEPLPRYGVTGDLTDEVQRLVAHYGLYDGDLNMLRFMELIARYRDIEQFLYEYERIDAAAAMADLDGVRVLTVHKSKGLEYEHVIVIDRLGRPSADRSPIIYEYDGIHLQRIFLRMKGRTALDEAYARAMEKEQKLAQEDALNALYVAFTRARETLIVIRKSKGSKFEMLELAPQRRGVLSIPAVEAKAGKTVEAIPYEALRYGMQTEVLEREAEEEPSDYRAIVFGLALHYTLEMMEHFDAAALHGAMASTRNRYGAQLEEEALEDIERRIGRLCSDAAFAELTRGRCRKEQPLTYGEEVRYIDLLVEHEGGWRIIDYKSSTAHADAHCQQVGFYKKAVEAITGAAVTGHLCYLLDGEIRLVEVE